MSLPVNPFFCQVSAIPRFTGVTPVHSLLKKRMILKNVLSPQNAAQPPVLPGFERTGRTHRVHPKVRAFAHTFGILAQMADAVSVTSFRQVTRLYPERA